MPIDLTLPLISLTSPAASSPLNIILLHIKHAPKNLTADLHSGLFSFHDITSHRSHYQHHTWSSIFFKH